MSKKNGSNGHKPDDASGSPAAANGDGTTGAVSSPASSGIRESIAPVRVMSQFEQMSGMSESEILQNLAAVAGVDPTDVIDERGYYCPENLRKLGRIIQALKFTNDNKITEVRFSAALVVEANKILGAFAGLKPAEQHHHDLNVNVRLEQSIKTEAQQLAERFGKSPEEVERDLRRTHLALVKNPDRAA